MQIKDISRAVAARLVVNSARFQGEVAALAERIDKPLAQVQREAEAAVQAMVTVRNPLFFYLMDRGLGPLHTRAWTLDVDRAALKRLKAANKKSALVFLPTHRSYADAFILTKVLLEAGLPRNYVLGGDNLGFFPIGTIGRRAGGVFMRRSFKDDEVYKLVVREYMRHLIAAGANLEWYMEGGRSRTGKLRPPKYGLLRFLVDAIDSGAASDILLVPTCTTYDQLNEIGKMVAEEAGAAKAKEGLVWLADYARKQGTHLGKAYVRFGEPFSLREGLAAAGEETRNRRWTLDKVAFEVFQRINRVTPVTAPALMTLALLGVHDHALTLEEVHEVVRPLLDYAVQRHLPTAMLSPLDDVREVETVLNILVQAGVVRRYDDGLSPIFHIEPGKHSEAAYYRNSAIHWFVNRAIVELGVMVGLRHARGDSLERGWEAVFALRDLLKFEFFFSEKEDFREEIKAEAALLDPLFAQYIAERKASADLLTKAPFLVAHRVLPAFLEAYFIVADRLAAQPTEVALEQTQFLAECVAVGRQYVLQKRLRNPECISRELFGNALALAANRGLLAPGSADLAQRRRRFADETAAAVAAVAAIGELDYRKRIGAQETH